MFSDHDAAAPANPPPPPPTGDEPEEWSASEDSDDALEESKGHTVTVTPPRMNINPAAGGREDEDEWSDDDMEGSPQAVAPLSETPRSSAAAAPASAAFIPTMGVGGYQWDGGAEASVGVPRILHEEATSSAPRPLHRRASQPQPSARPSWNK